jgi:hypothetical protein
VLPCVARQVLGLPRRLADLPPPPRQRILHCLLRACAQNNQIVRNTRYDERTLPIQGRSRRTVGQRLHRGRHGVGVGLRRRRPASHGRLHRSAKSPASPRLAHKKNGMFPSCLPAPPREYRNESGRLLCPDSHGNGSASGVVNKVVARRIAVLCTDRDRDESPTGHVTFRLHGLL